MSKKWIVFLVLLVAGFLTMEFALRKIWGFGETVLYKADETYEYIAQPNQERHRFGNKIVYNEYSMRSTALTDADKCIILGFGDSVINGGSLTDQDSLATTIVEQKLNKGARFLNVSAGSWGPDNCAAYLKQYGDFNAKMIVLFVSSHDAYDNMTHEPIVGRHQSYPDKQFPLGIGEVLVRYVAPRVMGFLQTDAPTTGGTDNLVINKNGSEFNTGFEFFKNYSKEKGIPLLICLHADTQEVKAQKFNVQGQEILKFCEDNAIKLIDGLKIGEQLGDFRDDIHINERGQRRWANAIFKEVNTVVQTCF
jgi:hypothetical protein